MIERVSRTYEKEKEIKVIVIDCLQLIMLFGNAREKISEIIDTLKKFARELNVIVILTSQLSRKEIHRKSQMM